MSYSQQRTIILLRHGQTNWNEAGLVMGQMDLPLSKEGVREAEAAVDKLNSFEFRTLFCSELIRCQQTAQFISLAFDLPITILPGLEERCWGIYEGRHHTDRDVSVDPPKGETHSHFRARVATALDSIAMSERPLVVTHSGVIRCIMQATGSDKKHSPIANAIPFLVQWPT